jgi:tRNA-dihydrouridine synthase A
MSQYPSIKTPPISIAPMMDRTDRHFRFLMRQITRCTLLYTEMVTAEALLRGDRDLLLGFDPCEHPLALQVGGDDPVKLAECSRIAEDRGFAEINLNVGCPSDRVQQGNFGACLMAAPETVAQAIDSMKAACSIPVTVKHRIGIDEQDSYADLRHFVEVVASAGADRFTVHARKAWLSGLSPKQNRNIPPLRYGDVHRLKQELAHLEIEINGGFKTLDSIEAQLAHVDAVMVGRAAYDNPMLFAEVDNRFFGRDDAVAEREEVLKAMVGYADRWLAIRPENRLGPLLRPMMHLFIGQVGARVWRRTLSERGFRRGADSSVVLDAYARMVGTADQRVRSDGATSVGV